MELDVLKCDGQYSKAMHALAMLMKFFRHVLLLTMTLRCLYNNLLGPRVNELLYFKITLLNSSSENRVHIITGFF